VKREIIRVEPFDSNFEKWGVPVSTCTRAGDMIFVSGLPPFDPKTGELLVHAPFEQQAERCLEELKTALEAAGSDLEHVMKVNVLCVAIVRALRANQETRGVRVLVGGHAFSREPDLWRDIGADGYARDAEGALEAAGRLLPRVTVERG